MTGFYWLASYPKSGNTWLRLALKSVMDGGAPADLARPAAWSLIASATSSFELSLNVEVSDLTPDEIEALRPRAHEVQAREASRPLVRKVHDAWLPTATGEPLFSPAVTLGTIYIVRDPRDVAVSYAHYAGISLDRSIAFLADPAACLTARHFGVGEQVRQRLSTWSGHVTSWLDARDMKQVMIRYEDMLGSPGTQLDRAVRHLGWTADETIIACAVQATRFDTLRGKEEQIGFMDRSPGRSPFFRRGIAGGWRDALTTAQTARIERDHGAVMTRLGYL